MKFGGLCISLKNESLLIISNNVIMRKKRDDDNIENGIKNRYLYYFWKWEIKEGGLFLCNVCMV